MKHGQNGTLKPMKKSFPKVKAAIKHLSEVDPDFKELIERVGPMKVELDPKESIFDALLTSIIYQQIHGSAAASILRKLRVHLKIGPRTNFIPRHFDGESIKSLRAAGVSESKAKSILDLVKKSKLIPTRLRAEKMSDEELIETLTEIRGIGAWTVQMLLIFTLGRVNVWPVLDFGVRKGFSALKRKKKMLDAKQMEPFFKKYAPFCSVAAWYCWRVMEISEYEVQLKRLSGK
jgi:3-methyladenine DNA glycosylase/8-oxoguanine DNA glycosylase